MAEGKTRLDQHLVNVGLFDSRARAAAAIKAGRVTVNGMAARKAAQSVVPSDAIVAQEAHDYVSRGGVKLAYALAHFNLCVRDKTALDIGASTGGFSDVLVQQGAARVYAVDVGRDQLHEKLRQNPRISNHEGVNARYLTADLFDRQPEVLVCDASFISLKLVLEAALGLIAPTGWLVALVKPQFEVGKENLGKNGVVTDEGLRAKVCADIENWINTHETGWRVHGLVESPITGPQGNVEFLINAQKK
jgi:23S rRNA (cytidine1920-2'-O)/16S rRNA (cytidine1409-2'-O)-methyltransferase